MSTALTAMRLLICRINIRAMNRKRLRGVPRPEKRSEATISVNPRRAIVLPALADLPLRQIWQLPAHRSRTFYSAWSVSVRLRQTLPFRAESLPQTDAASAMREFRSPCQTAKSAPFAPAHSAITALMKSKSVKPSFSTSYQSVTSSIHRLSA